MAEPSARRLLGSFLKARGAELTPQECGLPVSGGPRRVAGLRREEVARLAPISVDYYTRLEQGMVRASASVLGRLVPAPRLDQDQQTYLYDRKEYVDQAVDRLAAFFTENLDAAGA